MEDKTQGAKSRGHLFFTRRKIPPYTNYFYVCIFDSIYELVLVCILASSTSHQSSHISC